MTNDLEIQTGIKLPKIYLDIVDAFTKRFGSYEEGESRLFDYIGGAFYVHVKAARGWGSPVEFFSFLNKGGDAEEYGYLILAPELNETDFPLTCYLPGTGQIEFLGKTTIEAFENRISSGLPYREDASEIDFEFLGSLGIYPSLEKEDRIFFANEGTEMCSLPIIPAPGWHFQMTHDGTGVLAKLELFDLKTRGWDWDTAINDFIEDANVCLANGYAASALAILKDGWYFKFKVVRLPGDDDSDLPTFKIMKDLIIKTYYLLNKDILAKAFEESYSRI